MIAHAIISVISPVISIPTQFQQGPATLNELADNLMRFLMYAVGVISVVMITYAGFTYVISVGDPQKTKTALDTIKYTAVGFAIAIMAESIVTFVLPKVANQPDVQSVITNGLNLFVYVIGVASVIVIIVSGMLYALATGDPAKTRVAKDAIVYALVGLIVAVIAGAGITALNNFLNLGHL